MAAVVVTFSAASALDIATQQRGDQAVSRGQVVTDGGDYAAGGLPVTAALFGLDAIDHIQINHSSVAGVTAKFVKSTSKIFVYDEDNTSGIEAEYAAAAISATFDVTVKGRKAQ